VDPFLLENLETIAYTNVWQWSMISEQYEKL
jgi:hypothetical protein